MNYWANTIARGQMPEPVVINLDSDDGEDEIFFLYEMI